MLLNEFLKEHENVKNQAATIKDLKRDVAILIGAVKEQAAQIERLSTQVQSNRPEPQIALNNP